MVDGVVRILGKFCLGSSGSLGYVFSNLLGSGSLVSFLLFLSKCVVCNTEG